MIICGCNGKRHVIKEQVTLFEAARVTCFGLLGDDFYVEQSDNAFWAVKKVCKKCRVSNCDCDPKFTFDIKHEIVITRVHT